MTLSISDITILNIKIFQLHFDENFSKTTLEIILIFYLL